MSSRIRLGSGVAVLAVAVAAGAAGCSTGSGTGKTGTSSAPKLTAAEMVQAAAAKAQQINSFSATMDVKLTGAQNMTMSGTFAEQTHPLLLDIDLAKMEAQGQNVGPMSEIFTSKGLFMKMPAMSKGMPGGKPWMEFPASALKAGGLGQLLSQVQNSNPLSAAQLLKGATNTKTVGTGTVNGIPVTQVSGSEPATVALAKLPAGLRSTLGQELEKLGIGQITFNLWIDAQNNMRKEVVVEKGSTMSETVTSTVTSINQPVKVTTPPASQVTQIPASALSGAGL